MKRDAAAFSGRTFDLLVVGGGIVGAAAAWDAALRGLRVALVEAADFGSGTSWNSLKTVHGGLRHLPHLDVASVREGVRERRALLRIAPSLVAPLSFVVPARGHGPQSLAALAVGLTLYNGLSRDRNEGVPAFRRLESGRVLSRSAVCEIAPCLGDVAGAGFWQDAQLLRPEALVLAFVRNAADRGAAVANYVAATALVRENGRVVGARLRDQVSEQESEVRASVVLCALGRELDPLLVRSGVAATRFPWLSAINFVLHRPAPADVAIAGRAQGRNLFLVPWRGTAMIGTDYQKTVDAGGDRVSAFLADASAAFPWLALRSEDVALVHHGWVPGESGNRLWSRDVITDHGERGAPGLLSTTPAKLSAARALAERAVDRTFALLGRWTPPHRSADTPLRIPPDLLTLEEEVERAVRDDMALHLSDIVQRRLDLGAAGLPGADVLDRVAARTAAALAWSDERTAAERLALAAAYRFDARAISM